MKKTLGVLMLSAFVAAAGGGASEQAADALVFPHPEQKIVLVKSTGTGEGLLAGETLGMETPLAQKILAELNLPYNASIVKLAQCSRNLRRDGRGPNILFLSQNEGGFPRQGLTLTDAQGVHTYPELFFVDLVLDEERVESGELDIFSHEMGHIMMLNIWKNIPDQRSTKQHVSMGITDYTTAIFEGWGVHFQRLAFEAVPRYAETFQDAYSPARSSGRRWHSNIDQQLRIHGVLQNDFIHQKLLPRTDLTAMTLEERIILEHASPIFDPTRLRNAQQMLSCEGVLATLFYRMNSSPRLRAAYRPKEFYSAFLLSPIPEGLLPEDVFTPLENVILKHFWVWSRLDKSLGLDSQAATPIEYIEAWAEAFPEDREELIRIFVLTTAGKTVNNELGRIYESLSLAGMIGDYRGFRSRLDEFEDTSHALIEAVLEGRSVLDANVGPQLWIVNEDFQVRRALWTPQSTRPLAVNLNTASALELASFPGLSPEEAEELIGKREAKGFFSSFEDAEASGFRRR